MNFPSRISLLSISLLLWSCADTDDGMEKFQFESLSVDVPESWLAHADAALVPANPLYSEKLAPNHKSSPFWQLKSHYSNMPEHNAVNFGTLPQYSGKDHWFAPEIMAHSIEAYTRIFDPEHKPSANILADFELIKKLSATSNTHNLGDSLPFIPSVHGGQHVTVAFKPLPFANGKGFRFVTAYGFEARVINEGFLVYIFQGITNDGKTYVMATFPVTLNRLPKDDDPDHLGFSERDGLVLKQNAYYEKAEKWLTKNTDEITPSLATLDAIMTSIKVE